MKHISLLTIALLFTTSIGTTLAQPSVADSILVAALPDCPILHTGADTLRVSVRQQQPRVRQISPRQAAIRSLILPGLGQLYNRQYWKLPVVYGSLSVAIVIYTWNQHLYTQYLAGYREAYNSLTLNPRYNAKTAIVDGQELTVQSLKRTTDHYRRQRDLTVIFTVLGWALNAVEANVAAHLKTFDVSDDLSMRVEPHVFSVPGMGLALGIRVALTCK